MLLSDHRFDLADVSDLAGGTGIDFIDQSITDIKKQIDEAAFAAKMTMYCSIAAGLGTVLLLIRTGRK